MKYLLLIITLFVVSIIATIVMAVNHVHYCVSIPGTHTETCQGYYQK